MDVVAKPVNKKDYFFHITAMAGGFVKAVVDMEREIIALDAGMHVDLEQLLLESGSRQVDLWGINLYPELAGAAWIEFDSMINIRPSQGNRSRTIEDTSIRARVRAVVEKLLI